MDRNDNYASLVSTQLEVSILRESLAASRAEVERLRDDRARLEYVVTNYHTVWREWDGEDGVEGFVRAIDALRPVTSPGSVP